jgi:hypothetical protein
MGYQFVEISNKALSAGIRGEMQTAERTDNKRWNLLGNCIHRAVVHNDVTWVNKGRELARMYKSGMVNDYVEIARATVPFKYTFKDGWGGKIQKPKRDKMQGVWEQMLTEFIDGLGEKQPKDKKPKEFDRAKFLKSVLAKLEANDVDYREFAADIVKAAPPVVQEVKQGREVEDAKAKAEARKQAA